MTRLRADLNICAPKQDRIELILTVNTKFQMVAEWNRAVWDLEMATCESFLLNDDRRESEWLGFMQAYRRAAILWTLTGALCGRRMPSKFKNDAK